MKFDMGAAWNEAMRLISANRQVLLIVAGVFFFLPYIAFMLLFMNEMQALEAAQGANADPDAVGQALVGLYGQTWWVFLLLAVFQGVGMLGLLTLLTDRSRPTVGQALGTGTRLLLPYLGAQIVTSAIMVLIVLVPITVGVTAGAAAGFVVGLAALVAVAYIFTKFVLVPPVIAVERTGNPLKALGRSWQLTRGNSLRIFGFVFLIMVALIVISMVLSLVVGLPLALMGPDLATIGQAILSGLTNAAFVTIFLAVLAATYRQLAGAPADLEDTFG